MVNHSALCRSIKYDYMKILTWTILNKTQILNGCETFAFKYKIEVVTLFKVYFRRVTTKAAKNRLNKYFGFLLMFIETTYLSINIKIQF